MDRTSSFPKQDFEGMVQSRTPSLSGAGRGEQAVPLSVDTAAAH
jgi:hypothetical protein